jgi:hypothetical protein
MLKIKLNVYEFWGLCCKVYLKWYWKISLWFNNTNQWSDSSSRKADVIFIKLNINIKEKFKLPI